MLLVVILIIVTVTKGSTAPSCLDFPCWVCIFFFGPLASDLTEDSQSPLGQSPHSAWNVLPLSRTRPSLNHVSSRRRHSLSLPEPWSQLGYFTAVSQLADSRRTANWALGWTWHFPEEPSRPLLKTSNIFFCPDLLSPFSAHSFLRVTVPLLFWVLVGLSLATAVGMCSRIGPPWDFPRAGYQDTGREHLCYELHACVPHSAYVETPTPSTI